jgi:hypothetical protein
MAKQPLQESTGNDVLDRALDVISRNIDSKVEHDSDIDRIQKLFEAEFEVRDPKGTRKISSKILQQALWRTVNKMKFPDFQIHGTGRPEEIEKIVTEGVSTVATEGGLIRSLRDKQGTFWQAALYGDGFIQIGTDPNSEYPIQFSPISPSNLYIDSYATGFRSGGIGKDVSECVVVYSMSPEEAKERYGKIYPKIKDAKGEIKRYTSMQKEQERTYEQDYKMDEDKVEIAFYYNIRKKEYMVFAGNENTVLDTQKGDKYPFVMNKKAYIPVSHLLFNPVSEGFWNVGIGQQLYDLAIVTRRLMNMAIGHLDENTYPITLVNMPKGEAASFFQKLQLAGEMREAGKKGIVALEYDPSNPGSERVQAESLLTQNLIGEWQIVFDRLDREIKRLGINLDDTGFAPNTTATQIVAEEENADAYVRQVMEYNASECQFLIELVMDFIKKFISKSDKTPLNLTTTIKEDGVEVPLDGITMGAVADELKKFNYFVKINSRSGVIPSNIMRSAQIMRQLQVTQPGTPAYTKLIGIMAGLNDLDIKEEEFNAPQPQALPEEALQTPEEMPAEIDTINPKEPALI